MKTLISLFIGFIAFLPNNLWSADSHPCTTQLDSYVILQKGRTKPLYVHANETVKYLSGKTSITDSTGKRYTAVEIFCYLSLQFLGTKNSIDLMARVDHVTLKTTVGLTQKEKIMSFSKLILQINHLSTEYQKLADKDSSYGKALNELYGRISIYQDVIAGRQWYIPKISVKQLTWKPINKVLSSKDQNLSSFGLILKKAERDYRELKGDKHLLELKYAKAKLPLITMLLSLLALGAFILFKRWKVALTFTVLTLIVQTTLITLRTIISGRAPVTNMYETVLFSGFAALLLATALGISKKEKTLITVGLAYNICTLFMLNFAGGMLSSSIGPLVPVLRDNFWLSTHVTTIILSYGALALSWVLANMVLIQSFWKKNSAQDLKYYSDLIYSCLKYGTVLLFAGIILGGIWADYSWGRFWGWDPKETWSLIAFCIYMAILHGRHTNWIPNRRFIPFTALAFMSIMMAWFGVNYILASGLHSYGFSEGGAIFLMIFFITQISLVVISSWKSSSLDASKKALNC